MTGQLRFTDAHLTCPPTGGIDVTTTLRHFAIISYWVEPSALRPHIHERFDLEILKAPDGTKKALISVVPFLDLDFHFVRFPWKKWTFGQTNYRAYIHDRKTGERAVWFFGTTLDSIYNAIPRLAWKLPWHRGKIDFQCEYDDAKQRYTKYHMTTRSAWAPADVTLQDSGLLVCELAGCDDLESGLVLLTHPLSGYFYRRDGSLGSYKIWHDRLQLTAGRAEKIEFPLLEKLGLVKTGDLSQIHSIMLQHQTEFTIYLPPKKIHD